MTKDFSPASAQYGFANGLCFSLLLCLTLFSIPLGAAEASSDKADSSQIDVEQQSWLANQFEWLLEQREMLSSNWQSTATALDRFLASENFDESVINSSYVRIQNRQRFEEGGERESETRLKFKVDLPNTKKRVKLFFDSDSDDFDSLSDKRRDIPENNNPARDDEGDTVAGVNLETRKTQRLKTDFDIGVKFRTPLDPFSRYNIRFADDLGSIWKMRFKQEFAYFKSESWKSESEVNFYRPVGENKVFTLTTELQFTDSDNNWESYQGISLQHRINPRNALEYAAGVSGNSTPKTQVSDYWFNISWRNQLYEDWLFLTVTPEVDFDRGSDFSAELSLFIELELFFSADQR